MQQETERSGSLACTRAAQEAKGLKQKARLQPQSLSKHLLRQGQATVKIKDFY